MNTKEIDYSKIKSQLPTVTVKENYCAANKKKKIELDKQGEKMLPEFFTGRLVFGGKRNLFAQETFYYENGKRIGLICEYCLSGGGGLHGTNTKNGTVWYHDECALIDQNK